jgi:hypothetical protein
MTARLMLVVMLATATVANAVDFPDAVSASKCKGKKKIFGFIDDPSSSPSVRKIKMPNSFYVQAGSISVQGCKTAKGSNECQESLSLGLLVPPPGFTGDLPCFSQSGLPSIDYYTTGDGGYAYWTATGECVVTVAKYDETRGRLKGMYRTQIVDLAAEPPVYGELVGCFSAKRQDLGPLAE